MELYILTGKSEVCGCHRYRREGGLTRVVTRESGAFRGPEKIKHIFLLCFQVP